MTWFFVILAIAVITFIFLAVLGPLGELPPAEPDRRPDEVAGEPVFDVVVRGYRMDEVDERIAAMQAQIDDLNGELGRTSLETELVVTERVEADAVEAEPALVTRERTDAEQ